MRGAAESNRSARSSWRLSGLSFPVPSNGQYPPGFTKDPRENWLSRVFGIFSEGNSLFLCCKWTVHQVLRLFVEFIP